MHSTVLTLITTAGLLLPLIPSQAKTVTVCPLVSQPDRILVRFSSHLRADQAENSQVGPFAATIPAGHYKLTFVSYDHHTDKKPSTQLHEQWFLRLLNSDGKKVVDTPPSADLADDKDYGTSVASNQFHVPGTIKSIVVRHLRYPSDTPNSIYPVCAAFDKVTPQTTPQPTSTPTPSPTPIQQKVSTPKSSGSVLGKTATTQSSPTATPQLTPQPSPTPEILPRTTFPVIETRAPQVVEGPTRNWKRIIGFSIIAFLVAGWLYGLLSRR